MLKWSRPWCDGVPPYLILPVSVWVCYCCSDSTRLVQCSLFSRSWGSGMLPGQLRNCKDDTSPCFSLMILYFYWMLSTVQRHAHLGDRWTCRSKLTIGVNVKESERLFCVAMWSMLVSWLFFLTYLTKYTMSRFYGKIHLLWNGLSAPTLEWCQCTCAEW